MAKSNNALVFSAELQNKTKKGFDEIKTSLDFSEKATKKVKQEFKRFTDQSGSDSISLGKKISQCRKTLMDMAQANLQNTKEFQQVARAAALYKAQLLSVTDAVDKYSDKTKKASKDTNALSGMAKGLGIDLSAFTSPAAAATAAVALAGKVFYDAVKASKEFGKSISELGSITGLQGQELDDLRERIQRVGDDTKILVSDIANNFAAIGSALPQLLKNQQGLEDVSRATITLSKAGIMPLSDATSALTSTMAQFNIESEDASRVADVLANAAKLGAAGIAEVADSIKVSGTVADSAGVSLEETAALVEVLASKGVKGAEAGTQLRNVLIKLSSGADETNPKIVGMQTALENLGQHATDTAYLVKEFGTANATAASILGQNAPMFQELADGMRQVGTASEMASQNTNNLQGDIDALSNTWTNLLSSMNVDGENSPLRGLVQGVSELIDAIKDAITICSQSSDAFNDMFGESNEQISVIFDGLGEVIGICADLIATVEELFGIWSKQGSITTSTLKALKGAIMLVHDATSGLRILVGYLMDKWVEFKSNVTGAIPKIPMLDKFNEYLDKIISKIKQAINWYKKLRGELHEVGEVQKLVEKTTKKTETTQVTPVVVAETEETTTTTTDPVDKIKKKAEKTAQEITKLKPVVKIKYQTELGSIADLRRTLGRVREQYEKTGDEAVRAALKATMNGIEQKIKFLERKAENAGKEGFDSNGIALLDPKAMEDVFKDIDDNTDDFVDKQKEKMAQVAEAVGSLGGAFGTLGQAVGGTEGAILEMAGATLNAVAEVIPQIMLLIGAKLGEAMASGTASAAALPFPANLAAIASITATIISLFATIKSAASHFAGGGIIGGHDFTDNTMIYASSGEMVINRVLQNKLWKAIESGRFGGGTGIQNISFKLRGSDIYGSLSTYQKETNRIR